MADLGIELVCVSWLCCANWDSYREEISDWWVYWMFSLHHLFRLGNYVCVCFSLGMESMPGWMEKSIWPCSRIDFANNGLREKEERMGRICLRWKGIMEGISGIFMCAMLPPTWVFELFLLYGLCLSPTKRSPYGCFSWGFLFKLSFNGEQICVGYPLRM